MLSSMMSNRPDLTDTQQAILEELQAALAAEGAWNAACHDHHSLVRFLRARNWDRAAAQAMWKDMLAWRAANGVDTILTKFHFHEQQAFFAAYPTGLHKIDKQGRPVMVQQLGRVNLAAISSITTDERMRLYHIQEYERLFQRVFPACSALVGRHVDQVFTIIDLQGVSFTDMMRVRKLLTQFMKMDSDNYPETLAVMAIINAPYWFGRMWSAIKEFVQGETVKKIQILSSDYKSFLLQHIDADNLMTCYGGRSMQPLSANAGPWNDYVPAPADSSMSGTSTSHSSTMADSSGDSDCSDATMLLASSEPILQRDQAGKGLYEQSSGLPSMPLFRTQQFDDAPLHISPSAVMHEAQASGSSTTTSKCNNVTDAPVPAQHAFPEALNGSTLQGQQHAQGQHAQTNLSALVREELDAAQQALRVSLTSGGCSDDAAFFSPGSTASTSHSIPLSATSRPVNILAQGSTQAQASSMDTATPVRLPAPRSLQAAQRSLQQDSSMGEPLGSSPRESDFGSAIGSPGFHSATSSPPHRISFDSATSRRFSLSSRQHSEIPCAAPQTAATVLEATNIAAAVVAAAAAAATPAHQQRSVQPVSSAMQGFITSLPLTLGGGALTAGLQLDERIASSSWTLSGQAGTSDPPLGPRGAYHTSTAAGALQTAVVRRAAHSSSGSGTSGDGESSASEHQHLLSEGGGHSTACEPSAALGISKTFQAPSIWCLPGASWFRHRGAAAGTAHSRHHSRQFSDDTMDGYCLQDFGSSGNGCAGGAAGEEVHLGNGGGSNSGASMWHDQLPQGFNGTCSNKAGVNRKGGLKHTSSVSTLERKGTTWRGEPNLPTVLLDAPRGLQADGQGRGGTDQLSGSGTDATTGGGSGVVQCCAEPPHAMTRLLSGSEDNKSAGIANVRKGPRVRSHSARKKFARARGRDNNQNGCLSACSGCCLFIWMRRCWCC